MRQVPILAHFSHLRPLTTFMEYYTLLGSTHGPCNADRKAPLVTVGSVPPFSAELLDGQVVSRIPASTPLKKKQGRKGDGTMGRWEDPWEQNKFGHGKLSLPGVSRSTMRWGVARRPFGVRSLITAFSLPPTRTQGTGCPTGCPGFCSRRRRAARFHGGDRRLPGKAVRPSRPCCARCPSVPGPHSKKRKAAINRRTPKLSCSLTI